MAILIPAPSTPKAAGSPPKTISEFVGRLATDTESVSVAVMDSPPGWSEPGQTPNFDEYTIVIGGEVHVETVDQAFTVASGQAVHAPAGDGCGTRLPVAPPPGMWRSVSLRSPPMR